MGDAIDAGIRIDQFIKHDRNVYIIAEEIKVDGGNCVLLQCLEIETDYLMPIKFLNQMEAAICSCGMEGRIRHIYNLGSFHNLLLPNYTVPQ